MPYFDAETVAAAIADQYGTAGHLLKIWFVLKQMGMDSDNSVELDTANSTDALRRLFGSGHPEGDFFVPFGHTPRFRTMKSDASRSIIQTTLTRWAESGSVVTVDPTAYLSIRQSDSGTLVVRPGRAYPEGLGYGPDGFALSENGRVQIPLAAFCVWYYRVEDVPGEDDLLSWFKTKLREDLHLSSTELELIFSVGPPQWPMTLRHAPLSDEELHSVVVESLGAPQSARAHEVHADESDYLLQVRSMVTSSEGRPPWLTEDPANVLSRTLGAGAKALLLYGPPRTGKTRAALELVGGEEGRRIQIHDGWGYEELMIGLRPLGDEGWGFVRGPLVSAIEDGVGWILLEEINRTDFSRAVGEVFSLIEEEYRGEAHRLSLPDGSDFFIPEETLIVCTMNTLDRSTENVDDALFGRMAAIEFQPRVEALSTMLEDRGIQQVSEWRQLFSAIQDYHPLGHGFFAALSADASPTDFYRVRVRPVLAKHLEGYRDDDLRAIDDRVDHLFG